LFVDFYIHPELRKRASEVLLELRAFLSLEKIFKYIFYS
jgi:hypothetical protein